jgi:1-acyl-sn-glycerol-3-phosphate acyltransferase
MRALRSLGVWLGISLSTVLFGVPAIFASFIPPRGDWFLLFARGWARTILKFSGVRVSVRHAERLSRRGPFIVVANHESYADVLVLLAKLPLQVRFLAKRGVFRVPVLGWSIRAAGFVPVDRGDRSRGYATVETALQRLGKGRSLVVFPEETRTRTGELSPFKKGAALLALKTGFPILPVGIAGTRHVLPRGAWNAAPGQVVVCVGEPLAGEPAAGGRKEMTARMRDSVATLREEAAAELSAPSSQLSTR